MASLEKYTINSKYLNSSK